MTEPSYIQATQFFEYMVGFKELGAAGDEPMVHPFSPEVRAMLQGMLSRDIFSPRHKMIGPAGDSQREMINVIRACCDVYECARWPELRPALLDYNKLLMTAKAIVWAKFAQSDPTVLNDTIAKLADLVGRPASEEEI